MKGGRPRGMGSGRRSSVPIKEKEKGQPLLPWAETNLNYKIITIAYYMKNKEEIRPCRMIR